MTATDSNKIQQTSSYMTVSHHIRYLLGVADSVGYVILSKDLMNEIASSYSYLDRKCDGYRADEERRAELEKRRKAKLKESK